MNIAKRTLAEPYQPLDVFKILESTMVVIPQNKIRLLGKPGIMLDPKASICLSAYTAEGLLVPALHLCGKDLMVDAIKIELDSVALHIIEAPIDLSTDVFKLKPKDATIVNDEPASMDELKNTLAEIAFVRSMRLMQLQLHERSPGAGEIDCMLTLGKSGSVCLKKHVGFEGFDKTFNEFLGQFYVVPK